MTMNTEPTPKPGLADLVYLSDLKLQPVRWLWQDRLASGTLSMISGVPGSGKTWVALAIAAALSRGRVPYTGEACQLANVLYASMEHGSSEIIHPRFASLNGDPARFATFGLPVIADGVPDFPGPLAGILAALDRKSVV